MSHERTISSQASKEVSERKNSQSKGVILIILASESLRDQEGPLVWTIIENKQKDTTERQIGQISTPAETKKEGESEMETILGAIAEITDSDETLDRLQLVRGGYFEGAVDVRGNRADVAVLLYDGPTDLQMQPIDRTETSPNGWMRLKEAQMLNGEVRPLAHDAFRITSEIDLASVASEENKVPLREVLPEDFSLQAFIEKREQNPDIPLA